MCSHEESMIIIWPNSVMQYALLEWHHFYPRPVLALGYYRCLRPSVRPSVRRLSVRPSVTKFVRAITHYPFKLGSPNFDHRCKRPWWRSPLFWDWLNLTCKVKFNFKVNIYPSLSLWVCPHHKSPRIVVRISKFGPKMHLSTVNVPFLILGLIELHHESSMYSQFFCYRPPGKFRWTTVNHFGSGRYR